MKSVVDFLIQNKAFFAALLGLILSEVMSLIPSWKASGILQWIGQNLAKIAQPSVDGPKA
jgi:uncharacterized membrane protein